MVEMENGLYLACIEVRVAGEWKVFELFNGSLTNFEDVEKCQQLEQHVYDDRRYCAMPFLQLLELNGCCKFGSSEV